MLEIRTGVTDDYHGLEEDQMVHIEDLNTARDAWNICDGAQYLERYGTHLRSVDVEIDEKVYKLALLRVLSMQFESLSVDLETQIDSLAIEYFHSGILCEEEIQKMC